MLEPDFRDFLKTMLQWSCNFIVTEIWKHMGLTIIMCRGFNGAVTLSLQKSVSWSAVWTVALPSFNGAVTLSLQKFYECQ